MAATVDADKFVVPRLTDDLSVDLWFQRMKDFLIIKGLDKHIQEAVPSTASDQDKAADQKAAAIIRQCLSDKYLRLLGDQATARDVWTRLNDMFKTSNVARWLDLRGELSNLKQKPEERISDYVSRAQDISSALSSIDKPVPEVELVGQLLHGLTERFETHRTIMKQYKEEELTIKSFFTIMQEAEAQFQRQGKYMDPSLTSTAFVARTNFNKQKYQGNAKYPHHQHHQHQHRSYNGGSYDTRKCYYCNRRGHMQSDCPQKAQDEAAAARLQAAARRAESAAGGRHQKKPAVARFATAYLAGVQAEEQLELHEPDP